MDGATFAKIIAQKKIQSELDVIDKKRIRAVCEGDKEWLDIYNKQAVDKRAELEKVK
jgi:hypothetical protein